MNPYNSFRSIVFTFTTAFIFLCWTLIHPIIETRPLIGWFLAGLVSIGSYRLMFNICQFIFQKSKRVKKIILGNIYLEGVWVGCYKGLDGSPKLFIEYFEQTFDELIIRGRCYEADGSFKGSWVSESVVIKEKEGIIRYTYDTDMINNSHKNSGIAVFNFARNKRKDAPKKLTGYSSDIFNPRKIISMEVKIPEADNLSDDELLKTANQLFLENKKYFDIMDIGSE